MNTPQQAKKYYKSIFLIFIIISIYVIYNNLAEIVNKTSEVAFLKLGQRQLAISMIDLVPETKRNYSRYFILGRIYFVENNLKESVKNYTKSIELNPEHKESYYGRGLAYGFAENFFLNEAKTDFLTYIRLVENEYKNQGQRPYGAWAGYNDLAWVYFLMGDFASAEKTTRNALDFSSHNPWLLNLLASSLIEQGKCQESMQYLADAKYYASRIEVENFGEAYSGDNKKWWIKGKQDMLNTIEHNLEICKNFSTI